jgi:hypothetical protein
VELYESGFNYFCYGRDLKQTNQGRSVKDVAEDFGLESLDARLEAFADTHTSIA